MSSVITTPNRDLEVTDGNKPRWSVADHRRRGWHQLHRIARYGLSFRAARVMTLEKRMELRIAALESVRQLTSLPWFSAMVVIRDQHILFEKYAADFGPQQPHSVQSITKTLMNLIIGQLVDAGRLELSATISHYVPEIGSGYATATVQQVLNMDVVNDYSEDFTDPASMYYRHEEAMGWRLPLDAAHEETQRNFIRRISSADTTNRSGHVQYKDANTAVLGWVVERAGGRLLRSYFADIVDAAGLEGSLHITADREGFPTIEGGGCLTARDLARYLSLFVRRGRGVNGEQVGSADFIERTLQGGVPMRAPNERIRYSNHLQVCGSTVMHGGWGGEFAVANLETGRVGVFFSVMEDEHAADRDYLPPVIRMLETLTARGT